MSVTVPRRALRKLLLVPILAGGLLAVNVNAPAEAPSWANGKSSTEWTGGGGNGGGGGYKGDGRKIR